MMLSASTELIAFGGYTPPVSDLEKHCSQFLVVALRFLPSGPTNGAKGPHPPAYCEVKVMYSMLLY